MWQGVKRRKILERFSAVFASRLNSSMTSEISLRLCQYQAFVWLKTNRSTSGPLRLTALHLYSTALREVCVVVMVGLATSPLLDVDLHNGMVFCRKVEGPQRGGL